MAKPFGWRSLLVLVVAAACSEDRVTAPGVCPQFCASTGVMATDSLLRGSIQRDSSFGGYVAPYAAPQITVAGPGSVVPSRAVLAFFRFADTIPLNTGDTITRPVVATDSFRLMFVRNRFTRGLAEIRLGVYRLPRDVDTATTYAQLNPWFQDSTLIREFTLPQTADSDSVYVQLPVASFPTFAQDSNVITLGLAVRTAGAFLELGAADALRSAVLSRFVKVDSIPTTRVNRTVSYSTRFDTYVFPAPAVPPANVHIIGGAPSSRTFMRIDLPRRIIDSSTIVRATLLLVPSAPVTAAPGDTLVVLANALAAEIGPKSPVKPAAADTSGRTGARIVAGMTDTVRVDVTELLRSWRGDTTAVHTLALRIEREAASFGELRFWSTTDPTRRPVLELTFVPPLRYEGR